MGNKVSFYCTTKMCSKTIHKIGLLVGVIMGFAGLIVFMGGWIAFKTSDWVEVDDEGNPVEGGNSASNENVGAQVGYIITSVITMLCCLAMCSDSIRNAKIIVQYLNRSVKRKYRSSTLLLTYFLY